MTETLCLALDQVTVVGVVHIDFRNAFDSVSHVQLLYKLQSFGIMGDYLWLWLKDYIELSIQHWTKQPQKLHT